MEAACIARATVVGADVAIVAERIQGQVHAPRPLVTTVVGAGDAIVAEFWRAPAGPARAPIIGGAVIAIVAGEGVGGVHTATVRVTIVIGTDVAIGADNLISPALSVAAGVFDGACISIVAGAGGCCVGTRASCLVALIVRAYFTVIAECGVAATFAIDASIARGAEVAIVTGGGVIEMGTISLFASIISAWVVIVAVDALADAVSLHTDIIIGAENHLAFLGDTCGQQIRPIEIY